MITSSTSDVNGNYEFLTLNSGNYTVTPNKSNDIRGAITPVDASLIFQYNIGLLTLTPYQKIAADVTGNGEVTAYDAYYILRYTINLITDFPVGSDWTFIPYDFVINDSNWSNSPRSRSYSPLQSDQLNQDYFGMLYGEVSGDWGIAGAVTSSAMVEFNIDNFLKEDDRKMILPVEIKFSDTAYSGVFKVLYDDTKLNFLSCYANNSLTDDFIIVAGSTSDPVDVAFASARSLSHHSLKIDLLFEQLNHDAPSVGDIKFIDVIVDDKPTTIIVENQTNKKIPADWYLGQNHPNPFNAETVISYEVPKSTHVTIEVFNLLGQRLRTLVNEVKNTGFYRVKWNGLDGLGLAVGSGIYIYKLQAENFTVMKKMLLIR